MSNLFIDLADASVHVYVLFASRAGLLAPLYVHAHLFVACLYVSICASAVLLYVGWVLFIQQSG